MISGHIVQFAGRYEALSAISVPVDGPCQIILALHTEWIECSYRPDAHSRQSHRYNTVKVQLRS